MIFTNTTGSDVDVYLNGEHTFVPAGGKFEATGEDADRLLDQPDNWKRADKPKARGTHTEHTAAPFIDPATPATDTTEGGE